MRKSFLEELEPDQLRALPYLFEFWALNHQLPPDGNWKTWLVLGGRGAGKTRAGSEWVRSQVEGSKPSDEGRARRVALIGETFDQARDVMVFGESGILACTPEDRRPKWEAGRRRLIWPNGAEARLFSAHDFDGLRGPQFDAAWADELAKWPKADEAWDMLQFSLRLGEHPQQVVTTTPRNIPVLKRILNSPTTVTTHAPTQANRVNLAASFLEEIETLYGGTQMGRQEIEGVLVEDVEGALWPREALASVHIEGEIGALDRIVVAIDPAVTSKASSDTCGIIVAGVKFADQKRDWRAVVLEDVSVKSASPTAWAEAVVDAFHRHGADRIVAEVNQGGEMVEQILRQIDEDVPVTSLHASRGKVLRAEPVAALYEQGRVKHVRGLGALEAEMGLMSRDGYAGKGSPDRVDALVWALNELMIRPAVKPRPSVRTLGG